MKGENAASGWKSDSSDRELNFELSKYLKCTFVNKERQVFN